MSGVIQVSATIPSIHVTGGGVHEDTWRGSFSTERSNVSISIRTTSELLFYSIFRPAIYFFQVPQLPGLPKPGNNTSFPPFSQLLDLKTFHIFSDLDKLRVNASATFPTPLPDSVQLTIPSLPFVVSVPHHPNDTLANDTVPVVHVETDPLILTHPNTTVHVRGRVAALQREAFPLLSSFVASYLNGELPRIFLSTPLLHEIVVETVFPSPDPRPQVLRNVTVEDMKIRPLASGTVFARIVLPRGMDMLLQVDAVYPQLLIYDGPVPGDESIGVGVLGEDEDDESPEPMPLPDPLPTNAFAHIRPGEWLESISVPLGHQEGRVQFLRFQQELWTSRWRCSQADNGSLATSLGRYGISRSLFPSVSNMHSGYFRWWKWCPCWDKWHHSCPDNGIWAR